MTINWFWLLAVGTVAALAGFWSGRLSTFMWVPEEGNLENGDRKSEKEETDKAEPLNLRTQNRIIIDNKINNRAENQTGSPTGNWTGSQADNQTSAQTVSRRGISRQAVSPKRKSFEDGIKVARNTVRHQSRRRSAANEKRIPLGWAVGSPAEGAVLPFNEGNRKGAMVRSTQGCLYAPASGKIIKLYPSGNQMMLRTDFGIELLIRVGGKINEITGEYFRPRVLQNEIVNKGKLLLEYDREGLMEEGEDTDISISVEEAADFRDITVTEKSQVKMGEEILWVMDHSRTQDRLYF